MKRLLIPVATLLIVAPLFGQGRERGRGVRSGAGEARHVSADMVKVPVVIDLTNVKVGDESAVLGGYVVRVEFDRNAVEFVSADGGATDEFKAAPAATLAKKANDEGVVRLAAAQLNPYGPVGKISVASLTFHEKVGGGASSVKVVVESAASAFRDDNHEASLRLPVETPVQ